MTNIDRISKHSFAAQLSDGRVYTLSNHVCGDLDSMLWRIPMRNWEGMPQTIGGFKIVPYGMDNQLPVQMREVVSENNLAPGIIERQMGLLFGQGLFLNQIAFDKGEVRRIWQSDAEIESWLADWDYVSYVKGAIVDYLYLKGFFDAKYLTRGHRVGRPARIAKLEHIPAKNARLEWTDSRSISDVKHILVGDFENGCLYTGVRSYPVFDPKNPARWGCSASYNYSYSFGRDFYAVPQYWGALRWIIRGSEIPTIFKYVTDNGLNLAYHIHSPEEYWNQKRHILRLGHPEWDDTQVETEIADMTVRLLQTFTEVLSGKENAGKFVHTTDIVDENGVACQWKIEAIDQKIKDFVDSQLKIAEASTSAITSGMGLHPSLSNVMVNGKLASGSELLYAFKLYLLSDVEIASNTILGSINQAIAFNFPKKNLQLGFYHQTLKSEEAVSTADRTRNQ